MYFTSGIGPKTALKLIRQYKSLENIVAFIKRDKKGKHQVPPDWQARRVPKVKEEEEEDDEAAPIAPDVASESSELKAEAETTDAVQVASETASSSSSSSSAAPGPENDEEDELVLPAGAADDDEAYGDEMDLDLSADEDPSATIEAEDEPVLEEDDEFDVIPALYAQARKLFLQAEVHDADSIELQWTEPDEAGLKEFLVVKMGFNEERVLSGIKRLQEAQKKKSQKRMDR
jgi:5'-3' exonuclease